MSYLLSVIVPVYNKQEYLLDAINAIREQDYCEIEIILIDDGSTDNSGKICDDLAKMDKRISVVHQSNTGVSGARNKGIAMASGKYIAFADADDLMNKKMYSLLIDNLENNDADISICSVKVTSLNGFVYHRYNTGRKFLFTREEALAHFFKGGTYNYGACNKLYRADLLKNIRYIEGRKINEDKYFLFQAICNARFIHVDDTSMYYCYKRDNSASVIPFREASFDPIYFSRMMLKKIEVEYPLLTDIAIINHYKTITSVLRKLYRNPHARVKFENEAIALCKEIKEVELIKYRKDFKLVEMLEISILRYLTPIYVILINLLQKFK